MIGQSDVQGCIEHGNGYFRVDLCWIAMTLSCAPTKLIPQFLGYCYSSFDCTSDLLHSINVYTCLQSGIFPECLCLRRLNLNLVRCFTVKLQAETMRSWIQNNYSKGGSMAKISGLLCLSLFNKYCHDLLHMNRMKY